MAVTISQRATIFLFAYLGTVYHNLLYYGVPYIVLYVAVWNEFDLSWPEIIVMLLWIAMCGANASTILQWYKEYLYCSPLRQGPPELSRLWLIHQGGISHETTEVGRED